LRLYAIPPSSTAYEIAARFPILVTPGQK